jgi:hypothetical protein
MIPIISTTRAASVHTNPFPGLRPFREDEEYLFFGRENQVDSMVNKLAATRFLAVVGNSGSGKSSLVNCGLRPALHGGLMAAAGTNWRMAQFRPGSDPMRAMARTLAKDGVLFRDYQESGLTLAEIVATTLHMSKLGLIDIYEQAHLGTEVNLLVVVDQFEELFRYRQLGTSEQKNVYGVSAAAAAFVNLLLEAKAQTSCSIYVVVTMRSDFLGDCSQIPGLAEAINAGQYLVPRMNRDECRNAISGPVAVGGAEISPVLLTRLVNDVGDNPDQLSILQHALNRTWARWHDGYGGKGPLDLTQYEAIGTMARALDQHADRAYAELHSTRQQLICEKLFKALTDKATDPRGVRRPTTLGTLCSLADATAAEVTTVIDVFRKPSRSFLMPPAGEALDMESVIDISHESLMRVWQRLITWADEEAQSAQMYRRLVDAASRHAVGKASLWRDPDLQLAVDWRDQNQPNETWASQYGAGFDDACAFLRASEASYAAELKREEERQQADAERKEQERELEQAKALAEAQRRRADDQAAASLRQRRLMWVLAAVAVVAVSAAGFGMYQRGIAEHQTQVALEQQTAADEQRQLAEKQKELAEQEKQAAKRQAELAEDNRKQAERSTTLATRQAALLLERRKDLEVAILSTRLESIPDGNVDAHLQLAAEAARRRLDPERQNGLLKRLFVTAKPRDVAWPPELSQNAVSMAISRDDQRLFVAAKDWLRVVDLASGGVRASMQMSAYQGFGSGKDPLLLVAGEKLLILWNRIASVVDGSTLRVLGSPISEVTAFTASDDGAKAAFLLASQAVIVCDLASDCKSTSLHDVAELSPADLELSNDGKSLVIIAKSIGGSRQMALFDTDPWVRRKARSFRDAGKLSMSVDRDHVHVCTPASLRQYDAQDDSLDETVVRRFAPEAEGCRFFGEWTVSSHADGGIRVWESTGTFVTQAASRVKGSFKMALGKTTLVAASSDRVQAWDITSSYGRENTGRRFLFEGRKPLAVSDSLGLAAYASQPGSSAQGAELTLAILGTAEPKKRWSWLRQPDSRITQVAISADDSFVGVATDLRGQKSVEILDARDAKDIKPLPGKTFVLFAPRGEVLTFEESTPVIVSLKSDSEFRMPQLQSGPPSSAAFSRDGSRLALVPRADGKSNVVELFEWPGMKRVKGELTHVADVTNLSFNPDGHALLTSTSEGATHVWDVATQKETLRIPPPGPTSTRTVFTPRGEVEIWEENRRTVLPSNPNGLLAEACRRVSRNLTPQEWTLFVGRDIVYQKTCSNRP